MLPIVAHTSLTLTRPINMSLRYVVQTIIVACLSTFYSSLLILSMLIHPVRTFKAILTKRPKRDVMPAVLNDPSLGTHGFLHLQDIRMHYVANGEEGKPLMLLVHGFPEFWYSWRFQLREFAKDYRVVAIDMRGYGQSDKPSGIHNYQVEKLVGDLKQLIPALGYRDCVLVGHDWGGAVVYGFAATHPEMVKKLIVLNAPHSIAFYQHLRSSWKQFKMSWYMFLFQMPCFPEFFFGLGDFKVLELMFTGEDGVQNDNVTKEDIEAYKYAFSKPGGFTGPLNFYRAAMQRELVPRKMIINVPTLTVWGTRDMALDSELVEKAKPYIPDYTIKYVDGASHWVQMDQPAEVNKHIREFLS